jgi:tetratricopeptide (TPR) repeat protein
MNARLSFAALVGALAMLGCATSGDRRPDGEADVARATSDAPYRFLAFVEGDYQSSYEPNRGLADEELGAFSGREPDKKDTNKYLAYLATLASSSRRNEAEKKIKEFLADYPNEKRAAFLLGALYMRQGRKELASYFFAQLEKDPNFEWKSLVFNNLGLMALEERNRPLAIEYLEKATQSKPRIAAPFVNLGSLFLQSRSYGAAEKLFKEARVLDDRFEDATLGLGVALEGQGKFEEAVALYRDYLDDNRGASSVLFNAAVLLGSRLDKKQEGAELLQQYLQRGGKESAKAHEILQSWR